MRSYFEELCFYYGEEEAYARYKKQLGNLIIATTKEDNTTRLFMRSLNPISDLQQKNGWWNTFTITRTPCVAGDYICEIKEVRADKDGYPIFVVEPLTQVDEGLNRSNELMEVFYQSYLFTEKGSHGIGIFNLNYLADKVNEIAPVAYGIGVGGYYEMHAAQAVRLHGWSHYSGADYCLDERAYRCREGVCNLRRRSLPLLQLRFGGYGCSIRSSWFDGTHFLPSDGSESDEVQGRTRLPLY
jgi:hypothetical protein